MINSKYDVWRQSIDVRLNSIDTDIHNYCPNYSRTMCFLKTIIYRLITVFCLLFCARITYAHPAPSLAALCHGLQPFTSYAYDYRTSVTLNNNDHLGKEPVGFRYKAVARVCNVWQNPQNFILQVCNTINFLRVGFQVINFCAI